MIQSIAAMLTSSLFRTLFFSTLLIFPWMGAGAQATVSNSPFDKGLYLGFIPSADRCEVAFYEPTADGKGYAFAIFNLHDFLVRRMPLFNILSKPTPDLKGQYWVETLKNYNSDTATPNFRLHYSPDGTVENKKIYEGTWYPFAFTVDGKAIAATVSFKDNHDMQSASNLRFVDPATGNDVKSLLPGSLLTKAEQGAAGWGGHKYFWHTNAAKGVLARVNKQTGETRVFRFDGKPVTEYKTDFFVSQLSDTLLLGGHMYNPATGAGRLQAFGLMSGKKLLDTTYTMQIFAAAWSFSDGRLWAVHEGSKGLTEYALTGGPLKVVKVHPLDLSSVGFFASTFTYQNLIVSRTANRVLLFPQWDNYGIPTNDGYIWELSSGKLLHKMNSFYKSAAYKAPAPPFNRDVAAARDKAYLEQMAADAKAKAAAGPCGDAKAALKVKVGAWVREGKDGKMIRLIDYDCNGMRYTGEIRFAGDNGLKTTTFPINLFDVSSSTSTPKYKVVTAKNCSKCDGAGTMSGTRSYEKVEYGIYNKYTTTGTVTYTDLCKQCKGDGVVGY